MGHRLRYAVLTMLVGVGSALVVYVLTGRVVWAVVGLLMSGFVLNLIAEGRANGRMRFTDRRAHGAKKEHAS